MRNKSKLGNRLLAALLSSALVLTGISSPGMAAQANEGEATVQAATEDGLILYYDFDPGDNSRATTVSDKTGNADHLATLKRGDEAVEGTYSFTDENIYGMNVKALNLNTTNEESGPYLQLPDGIFDDCDSATISLWVKLTTNDNAFRCPWSFQRYEEGDESDLWGKTEAFYMWVASWDGFGRYVYIGKDYTTKKGVSHPQVMDTGRWILTTVVMDGTQMSYYENGKLIGQTDAGITVKDLGHTNRNFIGNSPFGDGTTTGSFAEFKIYNRALSAEEVAATYNPSDNDIIAADKAELNLGDTSAVEADMKLPSKGTNGSDITWASDNAAITIGSLGADGYYPATVKRPANGSGNATVSLTATIAHGTGTPDTKIIQVTVSENYGDQQIVDHDKEAAVKAVGSLDNVFTQTIALPAAGEWGSAITWEWKGAEGVISIPSQAEGGSYAAQVKRPAMGQADAQGKLKATVSSGDKKATAEIDVKVWAFQGDRIVVSKIEPIRVTTLAGYSPSLPNYLSVTYSDGSTGKLKLIWPAEIDANSYAAAGEFTVEGQIQGREEKITANVTVAAQDETAKKIVSGNFDLNDISLDKIGENGSILTQNRDRDLVYLKLLDNKRMLYDFYMTFGENDKIAGVEPLGGWDAPTGLLRGHSTGHYMSALALAYASTGDAEIKAKLDEMVSEMRRLQKKSKGDAAAFKTKGVLTANWSKDPNEWGEGFISAYSPDQFALLEQYVPYGSPDAGIWAPYYTLHKLLAGFLDAYRYTGNTEALDTAKALGKWAYNRLSACTEEQLIRMWDMYIAGEFGGFNESMAQLYIYAKADNDADADIYLKGAKLFDNKKFFNKLTVNVDDIKSRHANQHIPQIIGSLKMYEATVANGKPEMYYYNVAENFWQMVVSRYAYSIGGVGTGEKFQQPYKQAINIRGMENCETCAAYNMMKLTKMLNNYNPDNAEYMDYYERTLYNQILASQTPNVTDGMHNGTTYMLPIGPGATRGYGGDYNAFTCCHGTGMENHVKYQEAAYVKTAGDLYVGLYLPSTVAWKEKGVKVTQETAFPSATSKLTVSAIDGAKADAFNLKLRVPYWAGQGFTVMLNGSEQKLNAKASSYVTLQNVKAGDVIEVSMPWAAHLDKTPDTLEGTEVASVMYGPFVMAAKNSSTSWQTLKMPANLSRYFTVSSNADGFPTLSGGGYEFAPMFAKEYATEPYHAYVKVDISPEEGILVSDNPQPEPPKKAGKPGSVKAAWAGSASKLIKVTWKPAENATSYQVYRSYKPNSGFTQIGEITSAVGAEQKSFAYTDKKASVGKKIYYKVVSYNGTDEGTESSVASACILKAPGTPKVTAGKSGKTKVITVSFGKVANASGYEIYYSTKKNGTYKKAASLDSKTLKKVFKNAKKGIYYYKIKAYAKNGSKKIYTSYSAAKSVTVK